MAREAMVTRTVIGTRVTVLAMDTVSCEPQNMTYEIGGKHEISDKLLNMLRKNYDTEDFKIVKVVDVAPFEKRYGMKESDFIAAAVELPPLPKRDAE